MSCKVDYIIQMRHVQQTNDLKITWEIIYLFKIVILHALWNKAGVFETCFLLGPKLEFITHKREK